METMISVDMLLQHQPHLSASTETSNQNAVKNMVTISCGLQEFRVSRSVLINVSPYFYSALTRGWEETKTRRVDLPTISGQCMEKILEFVYTGRIKEVPEDRCAMAELLEDADYLQIDNLIEFSYKALADRHLTTDQFCEMFDFIEELNNQKCLFQLVSFLVENINEITKSQDFMILKAEQLEIILQNIDFDKHDMEGLFTAVLQWAEHDTKRCGCLQKILGVFDRCCWESSNYLTCKNIAKDWNPSIRNCLSELASENIQVPNLQHCVGNDKTKLVLLGEYVLENKEGNEEEKNLMRMYDVDNDEWLHIKELPFRLEEGMAIVNYNSHIYLFGGERGEFKYIPSRKVIRYCPLTNVESTSGAGHLSLPVYQAGAGVLRGSVYIVNGVEKYKGLDKTVQCYNPADGTCKLVASTTYGHFRPHVLPYNDDQLYIVSNSDGDEQFVVERYDQICNQWTMITQIPGFDYWSSAAIYGHTLVIHYDKFRFLTYDLTEGEWSERELHYLKRELIWGIWSIMKKGKLMLFGLDDHKVLHSFDVESMEWETQSCTNMERWGLWGKLYVTCI